jgi:hypothetical protein
MQPSSEAMPSEDDSLLDHVALECMDALTTHDTQKFQQAFHVLVGDVLRKLSDELEVKEGPDDADTERK